jgi:hypothetical protein
MNDQVQHFFQRTQDNQCDLEPALRRELEEIDVRGRGVK